MSGFAGLETPTDVRAICTPQFAPPDETKHRLSFGTMVGDILQPTHLLFILVVALLVLGPKRLPEVGRALGRGLRDFRSAISGIDTHESSISAPTDPTPASTAVPEPAPGTTVVTDPAPAPAVVHQPDDTHVPVEDHVPAEAPPATEPTVHPSVDHTTVVTEPTEPVHAVRSASSESAS